MHRSHAVIASLFLLCCFAAPGHTQDKGGGGGSGTYDPPGTLYDNGQDNGSGQSFASQDSSTTWTSRTADDFVLDDPSCSSGLFSIIRVRGQLQQRQDRIQPIALELYEDDGSGTAPVAGISPFASYPESTRTLVGTLSSFNLLELSYETPGLILQADTKYWLSIYATDADQNTDGFSQFFLPSDGAAGTLPNGVGIIPDGIAPAWESVADIGLGTPEHFSFAIDGACLASPTAVPTLSSRSLAVFAVLLAVAAALLLGRRAS